MTIAELLAKLRIQPDAKSFDAADKAIGMVKGALVALAAVAGAKFFTGLVRDTVELGGKLNDMAQESGTGVEELQELGYAAGQNSGTLEGMSSSLTKLSKNLFEAANGNKAMSEAFGKAGISIKDAEGELRPAADVLGDIADHIASLPEAERAGAAIALLGKSGASLIPTLAGGREALEAMRQEARDLGAVIDAETVVALDDFGDQQMRVTTALTGMRNTVVKELLPALKVMIDDLLEWVKANREIIAQKLKAVLEGIIVALKVFARIVSTTVGFISWMANHLGILAAGIGAVAAALVVFKLASIQAALASAGAWLMAALPIVIVAAGLFAIILILQDLYSWFSGGDSVLKDFFSMFKEFIGEKLTALWDNTIGWLITRFQEFIDFVVEKIAWVWNQIKAVGSALDRAVFGTEEGKREMLSNFGFNAEQINEVIPTATAPAIMLDQPSSAAGGVTNEIGTVQINVTPPPGSDAKAVAEATKSALDEYMASFLRGAKANAGVK